MKWHQNKEFVFYLWYDELWFEQSKDAHFCWFLVIGWLKNHNRPIVPNPVRTLIQLKYSSGGLMSHNSYDAKDRCTIVYQNQASGQRKRQKCRQVHPDHRSTMFWLWIVHSQSVF